MSNYLTEDEARTKWCPFARVALYAGSGGATANRHPSDDRPVLDQTIATETRCLGSDCMAWRATGETRYFGAPGGPAVTVPAGSGFCGLAGAP